MTPSRDCLSKRPTLFCGPHSNTMLQFTDAGRRRLDLAKSFHSDAMQSLARHDTHGAYEHLCEALRIRRTVLPPHDPIVIATLQMLCDVCCRTSDKRKARSHLRDLHYALAETMGPSHPESEAVAVKLHSIAVDLGDTADVAKLATEIWRARTCSSTERRQAELQKLLDAFPLPKDVINIHQTELGVDVSMRVASQRANEAVGGSVDARVERVTNYRQTREMLLRTMRRQHDGKLDPALAKLLEHDMTPADYLLEHGTPPPPPPPPPPPDYASDPSSAISMNAAGPQDGEAEGVNGERLAAGQGPSATAHIAPSNLPTATADHEPPPRLVSTFPSAPLDERPSTPDATGSLPPSSVPPSEPSSPGRSAYPPPPPPPDDPPSPPEESPPPPPRDVDHL